MSFGDVSARMKAKKKEEEAAQAPAERNYDEVHLLRARILGVLIRDARLANGVSESEMATAISIPEEQVRAWEFGNEAPSLPQLELVAYYLNVPVSHFWGIKTMGKEQQERNVPQGEYSALRDRVIGAMLAIARKDAKL